MHPVRRQRLFIVLGIVFGTALAVGLVMFALQQNINLFFTPTQISQGEAPTQTLIRAGGMVVEGSVKRDPESLKVAFDLTDYESSFTVKFDGILPDLFREGQGIVVQGKLNSGGVLEAIEVLAKHDENYMPPEVAEALEKSGFDPKTHGQKAYDQKSIDQTPNYKSGNTETLKDEGAYDSAY